MRLERWIPGRETITALIRTDLGVWVFISTFIQWTGSTAGYGRFEGAHWADGKQAFGFTVMFARRATLDFTKIGINGRQAQNFRRPLSKQRRFIISHMDAVYLYINLGRGDEVEEWCT